MKDGDYREMALQSITDEHNKRSVNVKKCQIRNNRHTEDMRELFVIHVPRSNRLRLQWEVRHSDKEGRTAGTYTKIHAFLNISGTHQSEKLNE